MSVSASTSGGPSAEGPGAEEEDEGKARVRAMRLARLPLR